jgi:hypothetical protein
MIIDHIDHLELRREDEANYGNELHSLEYLKEGLQFLYRNVRRIEEKIVSAAGEELECMFFGNVPGLERGQQALVHCSFHWYAVSACNYVQLVGWLGYRKDSTKAKSYVKRVLPAVVVWRNKVGAHFAQADPRSEDTPADLAASVMPPVGFDNDAFYAPPITLLLGGQGQKSTSRNDMRWSLTHTHRDLAARYWPDISL